MTIVGHGVDVKRIASLVDAALRFFALPESSKLTAAPERWNPESPNQYRGYFPSSVAGKQGLDIGEPNLEDETLLARPFHERNRVPDELGDAWLHTISAYFDEISRVAGLVFEALTESLDGNPALARAAFARPASLSTLRFNFYPERDTPVAFAKDDGAGLCCETHVDSGLLTLLYQDDRGGLQVRNAAGEWLDVPPDEDAFVVNTGLALQRLTSRALVATQHRVLQAEGPRLSIPFFFEPIPDFEMAPRSLGLPETSEEPAESYEAYLAESMKRFSEYQRDPAEASAGSRAS